MKVGEIWKKKYATKGAIRESEHKKPKAMIFYMYLKLLQHLENDNWMCRRWIKLESGEEVTFFEEVASFEDAEFSSKEIREDFEKVQE